MSPRAAPSSPSPSTARVAEEGSSSLARGTSRCVCHAGMCQGPTAHPVCPFCPDTSLSLPPARDPAAFWLALSTPAWTSARSRGTSRTPGAVGTGRARGSITHLSRCEASLCAVGSVLCSCLRARSLANSPWQSCTPGREKQRVRPVHSPRADTFCTRPGLAAPGLGRGSVFAVFTGDPRVALAAALLQPPAQSTLTPACPTRGGAQRLSHQRRCSGPVPPEEVLRACPCTGNNPQEVCWALCWISIT